MDPQQILGLTMLLSLFLGAVILIIWENRMLRRKIDGLTSEKIRLEVALEFRMRKRRNDLLLRLGHGPDPMGWSVSHWVH